MREVGRKCYFYSKLEELLESKEMIQHDFVYGADDFFVQATCIAEAIFDAIKDAVNEHAEPLLQLKDDLEEFLSDVTYCIGQTNIFIKVMLVLYECVSLS